MTEYSKQYASIEALKSDNPEAFEALKIALNQEDNDEDFNDINMEDVFGMMQELCWNGKRTNDSSYFYTEYKVEANGWKFILFGEEYIKDQTICDEYMDEDGITVINIADEKEANNSKTLEKRTKNTNKWESLFQNKTIEEIKAELISYEFPKLLK